MQMTEYETTLVVRPDIGGDAVEQTLDRLREVVRSGGGKLLAINHWGKKKLAYEIAKHSRGIYVHTHFLGGNALVQELERNLRISDNVLRFLTIRMAQGVAADAREEKAYERPAYDADDGSADDAADEEMEAREHGDRDHRDRDRGDRGDRGDRDHRDRDRFERPGSGDRFERPGSGDRGDRSAATGDRGAATGDRGERAPATGDRGGAGERAPATAERGGAGERGGRDAPTPTPSAPGAGPKGA